MKKIRTLILSSLVLVLLCGFVFPVVLTGFAQLVFPYQANGSLISIDNRIVGSELLGQDFTEENLFWGRPSAIQYNMTGVNTASGSNNQNVTSLEYKKVVEKRVQVLMEEHPGLEVKDIPMDLISESASGFDPHISREAAKIQTERVALANNVPLEIVMSLVEEHTDKHKLVNVLKLNIEIQEISSLLNVQDDTTQN